MEGLYVRRITDEIRRCGALVALHNCGTGPYFDLSMEYMQPVVISFAYLPDDCRDNRELKEKYGSVWKASAQEMSSQERRPDQKEVS